MKGDFSRLTGVNAKRKHYNGVMKQQGRVQLDSDWNELIAIIAHQRRTRTIDTIGSCGAPIHNNGFKISHPGNGLQDLLISTGRYYAGGLLCETYPLSKISVKNFRSNNKIIVDDLKIDGYRLAEDQWIVVFTDETPEGIICQITNISNKTLTLSENVSSLGSETNPCLRRMILYSMQSDYPDAPSWNPVPGQTDLVYLDVWERHISTIEDPKIRETALGGPDTDTRVQTVAQVKIINDVGNAHCSDEIHKWKTKIAPGDGRLKTKLEEATVPSTPCELGKSGGYHGLENHLYRVEIHEGGALGTATFKWSRDNASISYSIDEFISSDSKKIKLKQIGKNEILKIKEHDWLEISGDETDLETENPGTIAKVIKVENLVLTMDRNVDAYKNEDHPKIRRWDVSSDAVSPLKKVEAGPINLEQGIQVSFSGSNFKTGDYWVFAARAATGEIEELDYELPHGIKHHYCKLALVTWKGDGTVDIEDCRPEFPPLTELPKGAGKGCCTVTVGKDGDFADIQEAVDALEGGPGTVCILPGIYNINKPIIIRGRDITIKGCGGKSLILNLSESRESGIVFEIQNSWGITINDLWAVTIIGDRAVVSIQSQYVQINDCLYMAIGSSDNVGAVVFRGISIASQVRNCLIAGIVGIRFEPYPESRINLNASVKIEKNTIFALQSAILQVSEATFLGCNVTDNLLLGFAVNSLMKIFFPPQFLAFADKNVMFDRAKINEAKSVNRDIGGIATTTKSNTTPVYLFANHLKTEASTARVSAEYPTAVVQVVTASPVIDLQAGAMDANIRNNTILGKTGIAARVLMESLIDENIIIASLYGLILENYEGLSVDGNFIYSELCGILNHGNLSGNLNANNNRILADKYGIKFQTPENISYTFLLNIQIQGNIITTSETGIEVNNPAIFIYDFTAVDNSIIGCKDVGIILNGFYENLLSASYQRIIQRNSIQVKNTGIVMGTSNAKILDNDITITYQPAHQQNISYGISIFAENCTVVNNTIDGSFDPEKKLNSKGGIFIRGPIYQEKEILSKDVVIRDNRITGGIGHGIEIGSNTYVLSIENNFISDMGLNGIAVAEHVQRTDNLLISNNRIFRCNRIISADGTWERYAGIVLKSGEKIQILGNEICENGRDIINPDVHIGGIYAENVTCLIIADNQLIDNGNPNSQSLEAVINIPAYPHSGNEDIKVIDNIVKGSAMPALFLGGQWEWSPYYTPVAVLQMKRGLDNKVIITNNQFESLITNPDVSTVELQCNRCVFSNNYVECPEKSGSNAVDLGYGWFITVIGNITSASIIDAGLVVEKDHNIIF